MTGYNTHQDNGTVSIITIGLKQRWPIVGHDGTKVVTQNNHWDLAVNIKSAGGGSKDYSSRWQFRRRSAIRR